MIQTASDVQALEVYRRILRRDVVSEAEFRFCVVSAIFENKIRIESLWENLIGEPSRKKMKPMTKKQKMEMERLFNHSLVSTGKSNGKTR